MSRTSTRPLFSPGERVRHRLYLDGSVVRQYSYFGHKWVEVLFDGFGQKRFSARSCGLVKIKEDQT